MEKLISKLIKVYIRLAEENNLSKINGDHKKANIVHGELSKISQSLTSSSQGCAELVKLLDHESPVVRLWAAADLRTHFPEKVKKVLNILAKEDSLISIEARLLLGDYF